MKSSHFEVEQKFAMEAGQVSRLERALAELGATLASPVEQVDRYFAHPVRDFAVTDEALRLRRVGESNVITYKGPKIDATTKTRREIELPLAAGREAFEQHAELLGVLGFRPVAEVVKLRRVANLIWDGSPVEVALDDVREVGEFAELELSASQEELNAARSKLAGLAARLGLQRSERRSYLELLLTARA